jgi:hypothetical protein
MGTLVQIVLLFVLWRLWIPVTYQLGPDGIVEQVGRRRRRMEWLSITRVRLQGRGVLLIADRTGVPLALIHGVFVPWKDRREEVMEMLERYLPSRIDAPGISP